MSVGDGMQSRAQAAHTRPLLACAGSVDVHACIAEELLQAADQYMLEGLKRLCEAAISSALAVDTLAAVHETAENFNAPQARPRAGCAAL